MIPIACSGPHAREIITKNIATGCVHAAFAATLLLGHSRGLWRFLSKVTKSRSLTPARASRKRRQDILGFESMVDHSMDKGRHPIDLMRLELLGEMVRPGGGGKEILRLVDEVKAGKAINLDSLE
jgi:hypothetical protein